MRRTVRPRSRGHAPSPRRRIRQTDGDEPDLGPERGAFFFAPADPPRTPIYDPRVTHPPAHDTPQRYRRQALVEGLGAEGDARLRSAHALIVGCGALGCVSADLLARAGVGTLTICDRDVVEPSNLHRQVLFDESDARLARPKAEAARRRLAAVNSGVRVRAVVAHADHALAAELLTGGGEAQAPEVILDGTDNFATRYLLNDAAVHAGVPFVYAGAVGSRVSAMNVLPTHPDPRPWGAGPCLRCVHPDPPAAGSFDTCETAGVLGPASAMIAAWQAGEALKALAGRYDAMGRSLHWADVWSDRRGEMTPARDPSCVCCAERRFPFLAGEGASRVTTLCARGSIQIAPSRAGGSIDLASLADRLDAPRGDAEGRLRVELDLGGEEIELLVFRDGRAIIRGAHDHDQARAIYDRYVGA